MKHKIFHRYLSSKVLPIWTILLIDVLIIVVSSLLAYALRYDFRSIFLESSTIDKTIVWTVIVNLVFFRVFRTYSNVLRLVFLEDIFHTRSIGNIRNNSLCINVTPTILQFQTNIMQRSLRLIYQN